MATTSEVRLILNAVDNASKTIGGVSTSLSKMEKAGKVAGDFVAGLGIQFAEMTNPAMLAGQLVSKFADYAKKAVGDTAEYGKTVGDFARALGTSAEEASALIEIAGDLEIETGTLKTAMRTALKDGISPSIDGLKDMSKEYQQLKTPTEKAQFALEKFGRAGLEMQKILELAPEQLDDMAESARNMGLIMDEEAVQAAKDYRIAMMDLEDAAEGVKRTLGNELLPVVTDVLNVMNDTASRAMYAKSLGEIAEKAGMSSLELQKLRTNLSQQEYIERLTPIVDEYNKELDKFAQMQTAAAEATGPTTTAVIEQGAAIEEINPLLQAYSERLLFNLAAQNMDAEGALALARALGIVDEGTAQMYESIPRLEAFYDTNQDGFIDAKEAADGYITSIIGLDGRLQALSDKTITITVNAEGNGLPLLSSNVTNPGGNNRGGFEMRASGGPVIAGRPYIVGEQGPELFVPGASGGIIDARTTSTIINRAAPDVSINMQAAGDVYGQAQAVAREIMRRMR